jgi:hypothetical protein
MVSLNQIVFYAVKEREMRNMRMRRRTACSAAGELTYLRNTQTSHNIRPLFGFSLLYTDLVPFELLDSAALL